MRVLRLFMALLAFGPCPCEWNVLFRSCDQEVRQSKEMVAVKSKCCCHCEDNPSRPEPQPEPPACSCHDHTYISEAPVQAPGQQLEIFVGQTDHQTLLNLTFVHSSVSRYTLPPPLDAVESLRLRI